MTPFLKPFWRAKYLAGVFVAVLTRTAICSPCTYNFSILHLTVNNRDIEVEHYTPSTRRYHGAVIMLHGAAGVFSVKDSLKTPPLDNFGEQELARSCFEVFLPHYFDLIDRSSIMAFEEIEFYATPLIDGLHALFDDIEGRAVKCYYLFGESLGAFLALRLGVERKEIRAVSELSGGLQPNASAPSHRFAVLILHGTLDNVVPIRSAYDLLAYCNRYALPARADFLFGSGHYFSGNARLRISRVTAGFFIGIDKRGPP